MSKTNKCPLSILIYAIIIQFSFGQIDFQLVDPLVRIYPDENNLKSYSQKWWGDYPNGTIADVHLLLQVPRRESFTISATNEDDSLPYKYWSRLIPVPVEQNTGLDSRTEIFKNKTNPHAILRAPYRIYEVVEPLSTDSVISNDIYTALRLEIPFSYSIR